MTPSIERRLLREAVKRRKHEKAMAEMLRRCNEEAILARVQMYSQMSALPSWWVFVIAMLVPIVIVIFVSVWG